MIPADWDARSKERSPSGLETYMHIRAQESRGGGKGGGKGGGEGGGDGGGFGKGGHGGGRERAGVVVPRVEGW